MPVVDEALNELIRGDQEDSNYDAVSTPPTIARTQATTSSNPDRPRTLSAGYDYDNEVLTVLFRDGQWWEYRGVPADMWDEFKSAPSKGKYLRQSGLDSWGDMGPANIAGMPRHRRTQLNQLTRWANQMFPGERPYEG